MARARAENATMPAALHWLLARARAGDALALWTSGMVGTATGEWERTLGDCLSALADARAIALATEDAAEARRWFARSLRTYDETGSPRGIGQALIGLAATEAADGRTERAVELVAAAQAMSERAGVVIAHPMAPGIAERIEALKAAVPQDAFEALVARGRSLTPAAVLALVRP